MATIYAEIRSINVMADGDGGWFVKILPDKGEQIVYPLTLERAARLNRELANVVSDLAKQVG